MSKSPNERAQMFREWMLAVASKGDGRERRFLARQPDPRWDCDPIILEGSRWTAFEDGRIELTLVEDDKP